MSLGPPKGAPRWFSCNAIGREIQRVHHGEQQWKERRRAAAFRTLLKERELLEVQARELLEVRKLLEVHPDCTDGEADGERDSQAHTPDEPLTTTPTGLNYTTIWDRLNHGWEPELALVKEGESR